MSKAHQQPSSNGGYSSPRNLEHRLQMLPLASAGGNLSSFTDKHLMALPALQLPPPGSKTLPPSISSSNTKPRVPALPLAALPAPPTDTTSEAVPAAQQPLPVVVYKPKAKPVETAFGYRVPSGGSKQSSRSGSVGKSSILDSSYGSAAITPRNDKAAGSGGSSSRAGMSRDGSMLMGPLSLPDSRGNGSKSSNGRFFEVGGSKVPLSPRAGQRKAEAFSSNGSNGSNSSGNSSKIPKPPAKAAGGGQNSSNSGTSSKARSYRTSAAQDSEGETIFLDCDGDSTHTGGQSKPVGFTLSCAINAVFNVASGSSGSGSSGSGGSMEASSLIQTMGAALSRSIMSATQQHAGSHAQQREPVRGASRPSSPARNSRRSSNGNNSYNTPKQGAATSPSAARSSRGSVSAVTGSDGARSRAQSGGSTPTTKALQILPATSNFRAVGDSAGTVPSSSATAAGSAAQTATTIFMQLQGNAAGQQPASSRGASSPTGSGYDSTFYSCAASEATSVACSEAGSDKGGVQQQLLAPRSRVLKAAGPSILDPTAAGLSLTAHTTGTDGELVRYVSANTAASWATASEVGEIVSVEDSEQQPNQAQGLQQQQLKAGTASMLHSSTPPSFEKSLLQLEQSLQSLEATAAAAAAAEGIETATTNAAFGGKAAAADAHEREVVLTITPRALPFLAARAFSQTPVRLVITQDAVWGDLAAFTAAAAGEDSSSSSSSSAAASGEGQTKNKKKKKAGLFSRSARSSRCD